MRLSKIKLAGFKSFVDPTTISFPTALVGVVGPNGCGKSNVIDAVRWVMGESSASRLRGDSITDVIFNGSSARKPVGAASVELLFDNTESTLDGQYAKYAEISIRREVTRDGISNYYLNGARCRRKDITGIFLGTGLGPRSYSIIEQGMISRLIEAKPEDMRVFIEEAAGISKYKERRRETSNRIKHTKENLERLQDVLDEVEKQLKHLDRQAKTAERYGKYKEQERRTAAELLGLKAKSLDTQAEGLRTTLSERKTELEAAIAEQRRLEAQIEQARERLSERNESFNAVQGRFYKVGSEIARLEQSIEHAEDLRRRQDDDLAQAKSGAAEIAELIDKDQSQIEQLDLTLSELVPGLEQAKTQQASSAASLEKAEAALAEWQERWDDYAQTLSRSEQEMNVERTRAEQIESRLASLAERSQKNVEAQADSNHESLAEKLEELTGQELKSRQTRDDHELKLKETAESIGKLRDQDKKLTHLVEERREALQKAKGQFASLEALQKAALGEGDESVRNWLKSSELADAQRLAQTLKVADGWERAVETVLGDYLQAVCVPSIEPATQGIASLASGRLTLLENETGGQATAGTLAAQVSAMPSSLVPTLNRVRIAETLNEALSLREQLGEGESVVTRDGIWLSKGWLRVSRDKDSKAGVLAREHEMRRLKGEIREIQARFDSATKLQRDGRSRLAQLEERREAFQKDMSTLMSRYSEAKAALDSARYQLEQARTRQRALVEEAKELENERAAAEEQLAECQRKVSYSGEALEELKDQRAELEATRDDLRNELSRVRHQAAEDQQAVQSISIQFESRRSSKESAAQNLDRMKSQLAQFERREAEIRQQLENSEAPLKENRERLAEQLESRVTVEKELGEARSQVETVEGELRRLEQSRMDVEQNVEGARGGVGQAEMALQEIRVRHEGVMEQFRQTDFELESLLKELPDDASIETWDESLEKIRRRIERLGPINLAAIDEFKEQSQRKEYLDSQLADLNDALTTLENAIRKIDRETRSRFKDTYEKVDAGFKRLFPKLFGGGHAYLELTGDDPLSAGITVMARPPGKRNSTIHLLSGGEKALTAVALVFSIFELNPAPFCMLDEVDAPLDDANVGRFCDIVREMSDKVQFIFITHNKVTMELARQLSGVTMQEPGVSRLVSVDLDEAVKMAAS